MFMVFCLGECLEVTSAMLFLEASRHFIINNISNCFFQRESDLETPIFEFDQVEVEQLRILLQDDGSKSPCTFEIHSSTISEPGILLS